ncbi:alpha-glucuronidase [candidate division KSB1 bacterium]|nr:alpha-glucuronidase [candidate division KSB1 bacterium]
MMKMTKRPPFVFLFILLFHQPTVADDGYRLWLKYDRIEHDQILESYRRNIEKQFILGNTATTKIIKDELSAALPGLLGRQIGETDEIRDNTLLVASAVDLLPMVAERLRSLIERTGDEGFLIKTLRVEQKKIIVITANEERGVLYGVFAFLRLLQTGQEIDSLEIISIPRIKLRLLNHWDNLDRTVERGYAGFSLWDWHKLPDYIHPYYIDYARANASIGINGTVLNNVNANALILTPLYLEKVAALADVFRPFGIRVYLSIRFSAPMEIGGLQVSDPLNPAVQVWWREKVKEIYNNIPDFGGFLVKANSEGQPGPQDYGRSHADGANMLAAALEPYGGVVMWRAFVYKASAKEDRAKQAYNEFVPLDGAFRKNVLVQVKNGPIDFQPREPFHPLFGAMLGTPLMMEFQITQEYLGFSTHLVYLGTLFEEALRSDTYAMGAGSSVASVIDGSLHGHDISGIAGVANTGTDRNWTGHIFAQANWYAFGRLAWDHGLTSTEIVEEWIKMTLSRITHVLEKIKTIMLSSREITVNYMTPLGLHHIMGWENHYGPAPWIKDKVREDWTSVYYHRADERGIGFDRSATGSDAVSQYAEPVRNRFASVDSCPDALLLWFHHLNWNDRMKSGEILWDALCRRYYDGARSVTRMRKEWDTLRGELDAKIFTHVERMLAIQEKEAVWWRNACVLYFQTFSGLPIPDDLPKPDKSLQYYQDLSFPFAPK